jgi:1,4-alpha-glucan branching enzyme
MADALINESEAWAIVEGRHGDPFSVLGPHRRGGKWVVTAFVPGAESLSVLTGKSGQELEATHWGHGLFLCALPRKAAYRLRATGHGTTWEFG